MEFKSAVEFYPNIRIKHLANRLTMSVKTLRNLIRNEGIEIKSGSDVTLSHEHIAAVFQAYKKAVNRAFEKEKLRMLKGKDNQLSSFSSFYYASADGSLIQATHEQFYDLELEEKLIESVFFELICSIKIRKDQGSKLFKSIIRFLSRLRKTLLFNFKVLLHTIIPPRLFFIYVDEEENNSVWTNVSYGFIAVISNSNNEAFMKRVTIHSKDSINEKFK
ncbi:MAG TPA: hypothetical protein VG367_11395 [Mucilaginibacter sp.]|jgi:hypothetical protein|nr:hypothetical protein [Mucilaginibacter sp.]